MSHHIGFLLVAVAAMSTCMSGVASAAGQQGDIVQTDTLGLPLLEYDFNTPNTTNSPNPTTIANEANLSEFVGLHYFIVDRLRLGMNLQFTERLAPPLGSGSGSDLRTFAFLPQIGWDFWGPLFAAFVVTIAPWSSGTSTFEFGLQGVFGAGVPLTDRVKLTLAVEFPFTFVPSPATFGVTPLLGVAIHL